MVICARRSCAQTVEVPSSAPHLQLSEARTAQQADHQSRAGNQVQACVRWHHWHCRDLHLHDRELLLPLELHPALSYSASFHKGPLHCSQLILQLCQLLRLTPLTHCCADQDRCLTDSCDGDCCKLQGVQEPCWADACIACAAGLWSGGSSAAAATTGAGV